MKKLSTLFFSLVLIVSFSTLTFSQDNSGIKKLRVEKVPLEQPANTTDALSPVNTTVSTSKVLSLPGTDHSPLFYVIPFQGSSSGNGRAPQGPRLFVNTKYLITGAQMTASGFGASTITSVGWEWNNPLGVSAPASQTLTTTGNLKVFVRDTSAAATIVGSSFIDTTGATGYTKIIDGTITIPAGTAQIDIDVPTGGPGTSPFTAITGHGVLLIFVYKTTTTLGSPLGAPTVDCDATGAAGICYTFQSQTSNGNVGAATAFRPITRFGAASVPINVFSVGPVYSLGKAPVCLCPDTNLLVIRVDHKRHGVIDTVFLNTIVKNVIGGGTKAQFIDTLITDTSASGYLFIFAYPKDGDTKKLDSIIAVGTCRPFQDITLDDRATYIKQTTLNKYNQCIPNNVIDGGVGFNTPGAGDFVTRYYTSCAIPLSQINLAFFAATGGGSQPYFVKIFADDNDSLHPGALLYQSASLTSPAGVTGVAQRVSHYLPSPVTVGPGNFYVGLTQISTTTNIAYGYQNESPIREFDFFYNYLNQGWTNFADAGANFRLDIEAVLPLNVDLGAYLEGFYNGTTMVSDTMKVIAHSLTTLAKVDSATSVVNSLGKGSFLFRNLNNDSCYIYEVRQRNHIATWSHNFCENVAQCDYLYDYRSIIGQAYLNNMAPTFGKFSFFAGDANQDGFVNLSDITLVFNASSSFTTGYVVTDMDGNNIVNLTDIILTYNNNTSFVQERHP